MKKNIGKIAAAALTLAMAATLTVPTFAAEVTPKAAYTAEVDPATCEHLHTEWKNIDETCTTEGRNWKECLDCGAVLKETIYPAKGHSWDTAVRYDTYLHKTCSVCGETEDSSFTKSPEECTHENIERYNYKGSAHYIDHDEDGYSGDVICQDCGTIVEEGQVIKSQGHDWEETITKEPTTTEEGEKTYTCWCGAKRTEVIPKLPSTEEPDQPSTDKKDDTKPSEPSTDKKDDTKPAEPSTDKKNDTKPAEPSTDKKGNTAPSKPAALKVGAKFKVSGQQYKVTAKSEVSFLTATATVKTLSIPSTVKVKGVTYKVTSITAKAVKNNKKLKSVTIGANVKKIANNAFYKCPALKTVTIKTTKLTKKTASKKAFKGVNKKLVVKVPKKVKKSYAKIFKGLKIK